MSVKKTDTMAARMITRAEGINRRVSEAISWLTLVMVAIVFAVVVLRYGFALGWVWLQELYVWIHGLVFMLATGFTLARNEHVRVDIFYRTASVRHRAWIDLGGAVFFLLPFVITLLYLSWPYVAQSWMRLEFSREAGGLPGLFLLKSVIPLFCLLVLLQGLAMMARSVLILRGIKEPPKP